MGYLVDFQEAIGRHDAPTILRLWEEYTSTDELDAQDLKDILEVVKKSELRPYIGQHVERSLPLWERVEKGPLSDEILRLIVDLETNEDPALRNITIEHLQEKFESDPLFQEKMRIIGLRPPKGSFRGAISHYLLLNHLKKGNFVFHTAGWGTGEVLDLSMIREELQVEFDYSPGHKDIPFKVALSCLIPLLNDHFLARRFGDPDTLEAEGKADPVGLVKLLLKDVGPLNAAQIKDELYELVIPKEDWNRWWQTARAKLKKDTQIENPKTIKAPFSLLSKEVSHEQRLQKVFEQKPDTQTLIQTIYTFLKSFPETLKNTSFKESLTTKLKELLAQEDTSLAQTLQIHFFLQELGSDEESSIRTIIKNGQAIELIRSIPIQAFKKKAIVQIQQDRDDWDQIFLELLFKVDQNPLREYLFNQLTKSKLASALKQKVAELCLYPQKGPELTLWYFQKVYGDKNSSPQGRSDLFESLLILLSALEQKNERRDLIKKIQTLLCTDRFALTRKIFKEASIESVKEILLLVTKCHSFEEHDIKTFYSLAQVAHPSLKPKKGSTADEEEEIIWTTQEGYVLLQKKIERIATVETVDNAKEIAVARAHGDLRENAEFKAALERRDRLQGELKFLSSQLKQCRVLTQGDISTDCVSVGTKITCIGEDGSEVSYKLLGPFDANPEENILSFQSKLAKKMIGLKPGETVELGENKLTIQSISSAL